MIVLCGNSTGMDGDQVIPGGQVDRYLSPILDALPPGVAKIRRQPERGAVCAMMNHWSAYDARLRHTPRLSVQISHGIADKAYRSYPYATQYSFTVYPGPALADRAVSGGLPRHRARVLGYPKLDPIHNGELISPWPERDGRIRVLWAPTHGGGSERWPDGNPLAPGARATTWWHRDGLLGLLDPDQFLVVEAPHPRHSPGRQATLPQYVGADVVIADGGSTIYESWCVGLPVVLPDWLVAERNLTRAHGSLLEADVYRGQVGWHVHEPQRLADTVAEAAESGITDAEQEFAQRVLPEELRGIGGKLHADFLQELDDSSLTHRAVIYQRRRAMR